MACGSCGGKRARMEYEVTLRDGSKKRVATLAEVRIAIHTDTTQGDYKHQHRSVPKIA